jgi:hypothetical protein
MRKGFVLGCILVLVFFLGSCAEIVEGAIRATVSNGSSGGGTVEKVVSSGPSSSAIEFQSGEVLCSSDDRSVMETNYYVAKVLTQASAATKDQAEVVFVSDGKKMWVNHVIPSRKATKNDFAVGNTVFFSPWYIDSEKLSSEDYRKSLWELGTITSVEELYKNRVEVNGNPANIEFLRVSEVPIQ